MIFEDRGPAPTMGGLPPLGVASLKASAREGCNNAIEYTL